MENEQGVNENAKNMQPLVLAMIGDSVQTLYVRKFVAINFGVKVNQMSKLVSSVVNAGSQFATFKKLESKFNDDEINVARRARNAHIHTKAKNYSYNEYIHATALEAVFGYLYLTNQNERLEEFLKESLDLLEKKE